MLKSRKNYVKLWFRTGKYPTFIYIPANFCIKNPPGGRVFTDLK